jgi:hypothetical protein
MDDVAMKAALEMDQAAKASAAATASPAVQQSPVSIVALEKQLDGKIAMLSKTVALGLLDTARTAMSFAMQPSGQHVVRDTKGEQHIESHPPKVVDALKWMEVAEKALLLAQRADSLGDRPLARTEPAKG